MIITFHILTTARCPVCIGEYLIFYGFILSECNLLLREPLSYFKVGSMVSMSSSLQNLWKNGYSCNSLFVFYKSQYFYHIFLVDNMISPYPCATHNICCTYLSIFLSYSCIVFILLKIRDRECLIDIALSGNSSNL